VNIGTQADVGAMTGTNILDATTASAAIDLIDTAIDVVTTERAKYGAAQSRFESTINNLQVGIESQTASRGRIVDADFAVETAAMTRVDNVLSMSHFSDIG